MLFFNAKHSLYSIVDFIPVYLFVTVAADNNQIGLVINLLICHRFIEKKDLLAYPTYVMYLAEVDPFPITPFLDLKFVADGTFTARECVQDPLIFSSYLPTQDSHHSVVP